MILKNYISRIAQKVLTIAWHQLRWTGILEESKWCNSNDLVVYRIHLLPIYLVMTVTIPPLLSKVNSCNAINICAPFRHFCLGGVTNHFKIVKLAAIMMDAILETKSRMRLLSMKDPHHANWHVSNIHHITIIPTMMIFIKIISWKVSIKIS